MAAFFHPRPNYVTTTHNEHHTSYVRLFAVPVGRFLFSLIFIISGFTHFTSGAVSYAAQSGVPLPDILVPASGLIAVIGGLSVLFGFHARVGATLLLLFLVPVTFIMHDFWNLSDPLMAQNQMTHFLKNIALIGGACLIAFYGAGPVSVDVNKNKKRRNADLKTIS